MERRRSAAIGHNLQYDEMVEAFADRRYRHDALRRFLAALESVPEVDTFLATLPEHAAAADLTLRLLQLEAVLPDVVELLSRFRDGVVRAKVREIDAEAMHQRDARLDRKLRQLARQLKKEDHQITRAELEAHYRGDPDLSREPIFHEVVQPIGTYVGAWALFGLPDFVGATSGMRRRLEAFCARYDGQTSQGMSTTHISREIGVFAALLSEADALLYALEGAQAFYTSENWSPLARTLNRLPPIKRHGKLAVRGGQLAREGQRDTLPLLTDAIVIDRGPLPGVMAALQSAAQEEGAREKAPAT